MLVPFAVGLLLFVTFAIDPQPLLVVVWMRDQVKTLSLVVRDPTPLAILASACCLLFLSASENASFRLTPSQHLVVVDLLPLYV